MGECSFNETPNIYPNLNDQQRLNKINEVKDYFIAEIKKKIMSKKLIECIASFNYFDKSLIVLCAASDRISIASFPTVIGAPAEKVSATFTIEFKMSIIIVKELLKTTRNKKKAKQN